jgi:hypothetical protein
VPAIEEVNDGSFKGIERRPTLIQLYRRLNRPMISLDLLKMLIASNQ